jgi:hypothetical protein
MKYLLLAFLMAPVLMQGQDCKLIRDKDVYTKELKLSSGFIQLDGASLSIDGTKPEIDMLFSIEGTDKCFTDASTANIFFEGTKMKFTQRNGGTMNCEGLFHFIFRNGNTYPVVLQKFATLKVEKIVFIGNDKKETIVTLTPPQQQMVMALTACMLKEAPSLLAQ